MRHLLCLPIPDDTRAECEEDGNLHVCKDCGESYYRWDMQGYRCLDCADANYRASLEDPYASERSEDAYSQNEWARRQRESWI